MKASWIVLLAAPAVALAYDPDTLVPAGPLRHTVASVAATVLFALAYRTDRGQPSSGLGNYSGYATSWRVPQPLAATGVALAAWLTLATITGADHWSGLVGTPDRRFGLITWLVTIASVGAGARLSDYQRSAGTGASIAAVTIGAVAVAELAGWTPPGSLGAGNRWSGLWGQPAFLASASLLFGFVSLGEALDHTNPDTRRSLGWLGAAGAGLALIGSGTRGAMVGAMAGAVIWLSLNRPSRRIVAGAEVAGLGLLSVAIAQDRGFSRLDEWTIGLGALKASPWLGYGPEGYRIVFGRHVTASYRLTYGSDTYTDRAHQGLLDLALIGGVMALGIFVVALFLAAGAVLRKRRRRLSTPETATVAAIGAYMVAQQTLFPIAQLEPLAALYLGMVIAVPIRRLRIRASPVHRLAPVAAASLAAAVAVAGGAEVLAERGLATEATTNRIDAQPVIDSASLRPDSLRVRYAAAQLLASRESILDLDLALDQLEQGLRWSPGDPALNQRYLELLVLRTARSGSEQDTAAAWAQAEIVLTTNPLNPDSLRAASMAARLAGNPGQADALAERSQALSQEMLPD